MYADGGFYKVFPFGKGETVNFFLYLKEKRLQKRSKPACRWIARAINFVAPSFSFPEIAVPQNSASATRRAKRLEIVGSRTGGFNLMARVRVQAHHANHTANTLAVRFVGSTCVWEQVGASTNLRYSHAII